MKTYRPGEAIPENEQFAYITAKGGHYLLKRNGFFDACIRIESMPGYEEQEEFFCLKTGRIPLDLFRQALAFMEAVYREHKSEAMILLTHEDSWGLYVPRQEVSITGIKYQNDDHRRVVGSIHSHPNMGVTPSGTDEHDELDFDGIHLICNGFDPLARNISCFAVVNGSRFEMDPTEIIEGLEAPAVEIPEVWMTKVSKERLYRKRHSLMGNREGYPFDRDIFEDYGDDDLVYPSELAYEYLREGRGL